jgi:hypothetical protein
LKIDGGRLSCCFWEGVPAALKAGVGEMVVNEVGGRPQKMAAGKRKAKNETGQDLTAVTTYYQWR